MNSTLRNAITDLLLSDHETGGHPELPPGSRSDIEQSLLSLLVARDELLAYTRDLLASVRRFSETGCRHHEPLPEDQLELLLARGPSALGDDVLARLMLNPMALGVAQDAIEDRFEDLPEVWQAAYEESGQRTLGDGPAPKWELMKQAGIKVPEEELVGSSYGSTEEATDRPVSWEQTVPLAGAVRQCADPAVAEELQASSLTAHLAWHRTKAPSRLEVKFVGPLSPAVGCFVGDLSHPSLGQLMRAECKVGDDRLVFPLGESAPSLDQPGWELRCSYSEEGELALRVEFSIAVQASGQR